jgi:D-tyrosyl-tRNA(Tyr) deacylase
VIGLLQRVTSARVDIGGETVGAIGRGLLVLVCAELGDDEAAALRLLERLLNYRVFPDALGKMNLSLRAIGGGLLLVPQFTPRRRYRQRQPAQFHARRAAGGRPQALRLHPVTRIGNPSRDGERALRCRHAGQPDQRWPGHLLAARGSGGKLSGI